MKVGRPRKSDEQRRREFWQRVDRSAGPEACWPWMGPRTPRGYGIWNANQSRTNAHRFAWIAEHGPLDDALVVRHRCDNPPCCNPAHLEPGTTADNRRDMVERGRERHVKGEDCGRAVLTAAAVADIRRMRAAGALHQDIADRFGVARPTVSRILRGETWKG